MMNLLSKVIGLMSVAFVVISFLNSSGNSVQAVSLLESRIIEIFDLPSNDTCESDTPFANPDDCTLFWQCFLIGDQWYIVEFECPLGGKFDATSGTCVAGTCDGDNYMIDDDSLKIEIAMLSTEFASLPTEFSSLPTEVTSSPTEVTSSPTEVTSSPTEVTSPPTEVTSLPTEVTSPGSPPTEVTSSPTEVTSSPTEVTSPPTEVTSLPTEVTSSPTEVTSLPTEVTSPPTEATSPPTDTCMTEGIFPNSANCTMYYRCMMIGGSLVKYSFSCPDGSYFNASTRLCTIGTCSPPTTPTTTVTPPTTTVSSPTTTVTPPTTTASSPTTTVTPPTTTVSSPTTIAPFTCTAAGKFPNPSNCSAYYICQANGSGGFNIYPFTCPGVSYFDPPSGNCYVGTC